MCIENFRKVSGDYFKLAKSKRSINSLDFYTNQFNPHDYYIYKSTGRFKEVSTTEFLDFKYAGYIFFNKKLYDKNWLDLWIDWSNGYTFRFVFYISKPFPPFYPQKIKIY